MTAYAERYKALNSAYALWPMAGDGCVYCGIYAESYDHVPPLAFVHSLGLSHFEEKRIRLWLVPSCCECNSLLSGYHHWSLAHRKTRVKNKLRKKYRKYLMAGKWTEGELETLGYNLRKVVESGADIGEWIRRRLQW